MLYDAIKIVIKTYAERHGDKCLALWNILSEIEVAEARSDTRYVTDLFYYVETEFAQFESDPYPLLYIMHKMDENVPVGIDENSERVKIEEAVEETIEDITSILINLHKYAVKEYGVNYD